MHRDELAGTLADNHIVWDLTPGSYHRQRAAAATQTVRKLLQRMKIIMPLPDKQILIDYACAPPQRP